MAAHLYWRLNVNLNNGSSGLAVAELVLRTTPGGAQAATGGTASSPNSGTPANAFDGNVGTWWNPGVVAGQLQYQFASAVDIVEYALTARNDSTSFIGDTPRAWTLEYSDNGSAWTVADAVRNQGPWTLGESRTFTTGTNTGNPSGLSVGATYLQHIRAITATPSAPTIPVTHRISPRGSTTVSGIAKVNNVAQAGLVIAVYSKTTKEFIGTTVTAGDGSWSINCGDWKDVFGIAFNPTTYQALILDQIVPG